MSKVTAAGVALVLMTSTSALAQTAKYDVNVAKAAAARAGEKIGDIRGSIDSNQVPEMVTKEDLKEKPINTSFYSNISGPKIKALPPMTSFIPEVDYTLTGTVNGQKVKIVERTVWDKFDRYGNPIK